MNKLPENINLDLDVRSNLISLWENVHVYECVSKTESSGPYAPLGVPYAYISNGGVRQEGDELPFVRDQRQAQADFLRQILTATNNARVIYVRGWPVWYTSLDQKHAVVMRLSWSVEQP